MPLLLDYKTQKSNNQYPDEPSLILASPLGNSDRGYQRTYTDGGAPQEAGSSPIIPKVHGPDRTGPVLNSIGEEYALSGGIKGAKPPVSGYKDSYAKTAPDTIELGIKEHPKNCPSWVVFGQCKNGHRWAKELHCGKEWCPTCGEDDSIAHRRRIARLLPKFQQVKHLGYFVIEFPDDYRYLRGWVRSKKALQIATSRVVGVLGGERSHGKRRGGHFPRGLVRWHWFGDKAIGKWNPHINVLVDSGFLSPGELEAIKGKLRKALLCPKLIVNYEYTDEVGKMAHILKYVTRSTFRNESWDDKMAHELWNFRNIRWWGNWDEPKVWNSEDEKISELESGCCPKCHEKIEWSKPMNRFWLYTEPNVKEIGAGYYELNDI